MVMNISLCIEAIHEKKNSYMNELETWLNKEHFVDQELDI